MGQLDRDFPRICNLAHIPTLLQLSVILTFAVRSGALLILCLTDRARCFSFGCLNLVPRMGFGAWIGKS